MNIFEQLKTQVTDKTLHHAYVCVGDTEALFTECELFLKEHLGYQLHGNPDYRIIHESHISIDVARMISHTQSQKSTNQGKMIFVIHTNSIGEEAQNALLKVFEEPTLDTHFFILIPQDTLLPTFKSRVQMFSQNTNTAPQESFLKLSLPDRLTYIKKLTDDISDEKKTKQDALNLVNQVEKELHAGTYTPKQAQGLIVCEKVRTGLFSRGAMTKMLLEYMALSV